MGGWEAGYQLGQRLDQPLLARVSFDMPNPRNPDQTLHIAAGQEIADIGLIDERDIEVIHAENQAFVQSGHAGAFWLHVAGLAAIVLLVTAGIGAYLTHFEPRIVRHPPKTVAFAVLFLLALLTARLTVLLAWQVEFHLFAGSDRHAAGGDDPEHRLQPEVRHGQRVLHGGAGRAGCPAELPVPADPAVGRDVRDAAAGSDSQPKQAGCGRGDQRAGDADRVDSRRHAGRGGGMRRSCRGRFSQPGAAWRRG